MKHNYVCKKCNERFEDLDVVAWHSEKYGHHEFKCPELNISLCVG